MYLDKFNLAGRVAVVTGGGQAIGLACVEALSEAGARVVIVDSDAANAESGLAALRAKGHEAQSLVMDVTDSAQASPMPRPPPVMAARRPLTRKRSR